MNTVTFTDERLVIEPTGIDKFLALKRRITVPWGNVRGATHDDRIVEEPKGIRTPGTHLPGKWAGTFRKDGDTTFWNVGGSGSVVVVELRNEEFVRLVLSVDEPTSIVDGINAHISD